MTKGFPLISLWMDANAALKVGGGKRELGILRANVMGFLTDGERRKLEAELQELQRDHERQRAAVARGELPTPGPMNWLDEYLRILLKHADNADLFQTERIGAF